MEIKYNFGNEFLVIDEKDDPGQIDLVTLSNVRRIMIDYKIFDQKGLKKTDVEIINLLTDINLVTDLEELALTWINITKLPIFIKRFNKLKKLYIINTGIEEIPEFLNSMINLDLLQISDENITKLPEFIGQLVNLKTFKLTYTHITKLPETIGILVNLDKLELKGTPLMELPESIGLLVNLKTLDLEETCLMKLPESIGQLVKLQKLNLSKTNITELPRTTGLLNDLEILDLSSSKITKLSENIKLLINLKTLNISGTNIAKLPDTIGVLPHLNTLNLRNTYITELPKTIGLLSNLKDLDLGFTGITELPESIGSLSNLETLDLRNSCIIELPETIGSLINLHWLDLSITNIVKLPKAIGSLISLNTLIISISDLTELPEEIGSLTNLDFLYLESTKIEKLPKTIGLLVKLETLELIEMPLKGLPESIGSLVNLGHLILSHTNITELPESIGSLVNLNHLNLSHTKITELPESIGSLVNLNHLDLSHTKITELPESIGSLVNLNYLNLSHTKITELPESIGLLVNLNYFNLSHTKITELPESIGLLDYLNDLDLSSTRISVLPESIGRLSFLESLNLSFCKLMKLQKAILTLNLPLSFELKNESSGIILYKTQFAKISAYLLEHSQEYIKLYCNKLNKSMVLYNEIRIVFLGDGGSGKTTIIEILKGNLYLENREKTNGIVISNLNINEIENETVKFHFWDFGGQEIYHSIHEMFLRDNCVYVIVLDGRKEDRPEYWLEFVKRYSRKSPILLVVNKCDNGIIENKLSLYELSEKFSDKVLCDFEPSFISCKSQYGIKEFKEKLYAVACRFAKLKKWPVSWLKVKRELEDMRDQNGCTINYIDQKTYYQYCEKGGIKDLKNKNILLSILCDFGTVFSYQSKNRNNIIDELIVLRPEWITEGIYRIIDSDISKRSKGYIPLNKMEEIFTDVEGMNQIVTYFPSERDFVISLMEKFKISYQIGEYEFIPSLAQSERPESLKNWDFNISIFYETDGVFPGSLLYQFIVELSHDVKVEFTWNKGTLLSSKIYNVEALIQIKDNKFYIQLDKSSEEAYKYLSILCVTFQRLLYGLNINCSEHVGVCHNNSWRYLNFDRMINMLANGKKTEYIDGDGWDCDVEIIEVLSCITPYTVMQKINDELTIAKEEKKRNKNLRENLDRILKKNEDDHQRMRAYLEMIHYDVKDINQLLTALKKELPYDLSDISKKIDEAIVEIKTGNQVSAYRKIKNILSDISNFNTIIQLSPAIIEMIKLL